MYFNCTVSYCALLLLVALRQASGQFDEETTLEVEPTVTSESPEITTSEPETTTSAATDTSSSTSTVTTISTLPPRDCLDSHPLCVFWRYEGECVRNEDFMNFFCRKACKACDVYPRTVPVVQNDTTIQCGDQQDLCVFWSKRAQCNRNFYWMLQNCPFSCGYCSTKCRICPPPSDAPPGIPDPPKLYYGNRAFQAGIPQVDFSNYQPNVPLKAFGLYGDPYLNFRSRRTKRGAIRTYGTAQNHAHGGAGWTDLPSRHGHDCHKRPKCVTAAPLPCCIPVALAQAQGLLPLGAYVTPATLPTEAPVVTETEINLEIISIPANETFETTLETAETPSGTEEFGTPENGGGEIEVTTVESTAEPTTEESTGGPTEVEATTGADEEPTEPPTSTSPE